MRKDPIYQTVLSYAIANNATVEQAESLTRQQVSSIVGYEAIISEAFLVNMRVGIATELRDRDDAEHMDGLKQQAKSWLDANFPHWEADKGREFGKPFVTIWLEGKPQWL